MSSIDLVTPDFARLFGRVGELGAASTPLLTEATRLALLEEARAYSYRAEQEAVGSGDRVVRQQMGSLEEFRPQSRFVELRDCLQGLLDRALAAADPALFATPLRLDRIVLQRYPGGSLGITPHRDNLRYINLICVIVIGGRGRFFVCADRSGRDSVEIPADPGRMILMRAPGFLGSARRPFHYVTEVTQERFTFGLRQTRRADE